MSGRNSLVTGGRGFVGAWLVKGLLGRGDRVISFDVEADPGRRSGLELLGIEGEAEEARGDLRDAELVSRTIARNDVDAMVSPRQAFGVGLNTALLLRQHTLEVARRPCTRCAEC